MTIFIETQADRMLKQSVLSARMAMAITDPRRPDNPIIFVNPAFSEMTGYAASEVLGRNCRFLQGAKTDHEAVKTLRRALDEKRDIEVDLLNYKRSGELFHNRLFVSPVFDDGGELIHFFASQLDVTLAKRSEAISRRREGVLRQINSSLNERLRTTFSAVQIIVRNALTAASSVVSAADDISAKLVSLGHVHRSLLKDDWNDLELEGVVRSITTAFPSARDRFQFAGPKITLDPLLSFRIATLLHDFCVESIQHGALGTNGGRVRICWSPTYEQGLKEISFGWLEMFEEAAESSDGALRPLRSAKLRSESGCLVQRDAAQKEIRYLFDVDARESLASEMAD